VILPSGSKGPSSVSRYQFAGQGVVQKEADDGHDQRTGERRDESVDAKAEPQSPSDRLVSMNISALTPFPGGDLQINEASASRNRIWSSRVARNGL